MSRSSPRAEFGSEITATGKGTVSALPNAPLTPCHSARSRMIREANHPAEWRELEVKLACGVSFILTRLWIVNDRLGRVASGCDSVAGGCALTRALAKTDFGCAASDHAKFADLCPFFLDFVAIGLPAMSLPHFSSRVQSAKKTIVRLAGRFGSR